MPELYYGLVVFGAAGIALVIYNFIILRWCFNYPHTADLPSGRERMQLETRRGASSSMSFDNPNAHLISSFKYKKGGVGANHNDHECAVCLSVFEEDEELKQLPRCKHSFHASCIDMWLYSHLDCPLCRSPVDSGPFLNRVDATRTTGNTGEGLMASISV